MCINKTATIADCLSCSMSRSCADRRPMDGYQLLTIIENEELAYEDFTKCRRASAEYLGKIAALEKELKATKVLLECAQGMEDQAYKFFKECAAKSRKEPKRD